MKEGKIQANKNIQIDRPNETDRQSTGQTRTVVL